MDNERRNRVMNLKSAFWALTALALAGCSGDTLTDHEREVLAQMKLGELPPSPSNAVADNPAAAELGHQLFFDRRFSGPLLQGSDPGAGGLGAAGTAGMVACATCHDPAHGGADSRARSATSLASGWTSRNALSVQNAAFSAWLFWDGRKDSLWSQSLGPVENENEHNTTRLEIAHTIAEKYRQSYQAIFGPLPALDDEARFPRVGRPGMPTFNGMAADDKVAVNRVFANFGKAVEAYERQLIDHSSPFDRYVLGDETALSASAIRGAKLFVGRAACNECHSGTTFSDGKFHNHGVPQSGAKVPTVDNGRSDGITKVLADEFNGASRYSDAARSLDGVKSAASDLGAFKTPTLRNVSKTGPYMHTGAFSSLWDVVTWYNEAAGIDGFAGKREAASAFPLRLANDEIADLVEFLKSLDGDPLPAALVSAPALP
jgi:cytochrome c peroxidase